MKKLALAAFMLFLSGNGYIHSQPWMKEMRLKSTEEANFYNIQSAFNEYWKDRQIERSKGYNPFKRWEYFMEPRVYPSGKIDNRAFQKAFWAYCIDKSSDKASPIWNYIGPSQIPYIIGTTNKSGNGRIQEQ